MTCPHCLNKTLPDPDTEGLEYADDRRWCPECEKKTRSKKCLPESAAGPYYHTESAHHEGMWWIHHEDGRCVVKTPLPEEGARATAAGLNQHYA